MTLTNGNNGILNSFKVVGFEKIKAREIYQHALKPNVFESMSILGNRLGCSEMYYNFVCPDFDEQVDDAILDIQDDVLDRFGIVVNTYSFKQLLENKAKGVGSQRKNSYLQIMRTAYNSLKEHKDFMPWIE
jgi:hypothetical protein